MPTIDTNGVRLNYRESGSGPENVVFAHGLLMDHCMYRAQIEALSARYRCIAYDHRGQGGSEVTDHGYDMDSLTRDAKELIQALNAAPCHFVGLSMGGFVGLRLAMRHPELLQSLVLIDTSAEPEPPRSRRKYAVMISIARWLGFRPLAGTVMSILFGHSFMQDPARREEREFWKHRLLGLNRAGVLRAERAVIERQGVVERLQEIQVPTLVLVGEEDTATPPPLAERLHDGIAASTLAVIPGAGHSPTIEQPATVNVQLQNFLAAAGP